MFLSSCPFSDTWPQPWQDCLAHFLESKFHKSHSSETVRNYASHLRKFFTDIGKEPEAVTNADVLRFLEMRYDGRDVPLSTSERNQRIVVLKSFYEFAARYQIMIDGTKCLLFTGISPVLGLQQGQKLQEDRSLSDSELQRLFAVIPNTPRGLRDKAVFLCYLYTARRKSEIMRLTWGDISRETMIDAKGVRRVGYVYRFHGKGRSQVEDRAELPPLAYAAIVAYLQATGRYVGIKASDPVFARVGWRGRKRHDGEPGLAGGTIYHRFKAYARQAGLSEKACLHSFRHTSARIRHQGGASVQEIQHLLRHAHPETTWRYLGTFTSEADTSFRLVEQVARYL